jgi:CHAT domain-containing protein/predicted negative regulator of RcsB-dependent stress response
MELPAREHPDRVRDEIARMLRLAAGASTSSEAAAPLATARELAEAYAVAWTDSFFVRQVARFESATTEQRADMAAADSLLRTARVVIGQEGVPAAMALWRESLRRATAAGDSAARAASLASLGAGHYLGGEGDSAAVYLEQGRHLAETVGDHRTAGNAVGNLASVYKDSGDLARAAELYRQASAIRPRTGDSRGLAADQNNIGLIAWTLGDLNGAREAFEEALALNRRDGRDRESARNLTNLGDIASIDGDYAAAQALYEEALAINRSSGDDAETGFVLHDLGLLASRRGDYVLSRELLSHALAVHERSGATLEAVAVQADLAAVQAVTGDMDGALASLERAGREGVGAGIPSLQGAIALARADLLVQLGAYDEADGEYARAEASYRESGEGGGRAAAYAGHALLAHLWEDHEGALRHLDLAARAHEADGDRRSASLTQLLEGVVRREMGDTSEARRTLSSAHQTLVELGDAAGAGAVLSALGDLALDRGQAVSAEAHYRRGLEQLGDRQAVDVRWRLHAGLGGALRRQGALGEAAEQLRASIAAIEEVAAGIRLEHRRAGFMSDKWEPYTTLALLEHERGRVAEAFAISEQMRGRQTLAMLDRGRVATRHDPSEREQDLRRRIGELLGEIEEAGPGHGGLREPPLAERRVEAAREELAAAQTEYADLLLELRTSRPGYARLVSPEPIGLRDAAARLASDEALLQYLVAESGAVVFVLTQDTVVALDLDIRREELANLIDFTRGVIERPAGPGMTALWPAPLRRLHHHLIEPVERAGFLEGRRSLVIVPHAELHFLPFGALLEPPPPGAQEGPGRFLIERFQLSYAPSTTVWARQRERPARTSSGRVLALAPRTDLLPASRDEVRGIQAVFGRRAAVLVDGAASKQALRAAAPRYDILHVASFGVFNKHNPLFSYVELAPYAGDDGRLEVHEVFGLGLEGQLVVLSACQTGLGSGPLADVPAGDDWVGLMQGFVQAGAGGVLASLWRVDDPATAELMQRFYRHLRSGETEAAALASAQRELLRASRTAHPLYWAGFILSGGGGS